jgi:Zn finger protein HypA/HybF involved in hydrogenase expression
MNKIYELSDNDFRELIINSGNIKEVLFKLNLTSTGNSWGYSQIRRRMESLNLDGSNFKGKNTIVKTIEKKIKKEDLFKENCKHGRNVTRRTILRDQLIDYRCAMCGINSWNDKKLSLELDHINGINNDNRLENLRFLCPNCHSQTTTYGSRNQQLNESKYDITEELAKLVLEEYDKVHSIKKVKTNLNIREVVIKKIISDNGLSRANQKYVVRYDLNKNELNRFGSITEAAQFLMDNNLLKTKLIKTARTTLLRNINKQPYLNNYWDILDV